MFKPFNTSNPELVFMIIAFAPEILLIIYSLNFILIVKNYY